MKQQNELEETQQAEIGGEATVNLMSNSNTDNMSGIKPPKNFVINSELDMSQEWMEWVEFYDNYFIEAKINKEGGEIQKVNFISAAGQMF